MYRINLYATLYLDSLHKAGEALPPTERKMNIQRMLVQLRIEKEDDEAINKILNIIEPMTQLLQLVKQIKSDSPPSSEA